MRWLGVFVVAVVSGCALMPAAAPDDGRVDALQDFAEVYGVVRYFHPSDAAAAADWDRVAVDGVARLLDAPQSSEEILRAIFDPLMVSEQWLAPGENPVPIETTGAPVVAWQHLGPGRVGGRSRAYRSVRVNAEGQEPLFEALPGAGEMTLIELADGSRLAIPLALEQGRSADGAALPPPWPEVTDRRVGPLADLVVAWAALRHFFPYTESVAIDWDAQLRGGLEVALADPDERHTIDILRRMLHVLQDGHARVQAPTPVRWSHPRVRLAWIDRQVVVEAALPQTGLAPGDVILDVDGEPAAGRLASLMQEFSGSMQARRRMALDGLCRQPDGRSTRLDIRRGGRTLTVYASSAGEAWRLHEAPVRDLGDGVLYFRLSGAPVSDVEANFERLMQARAIVFDLRGYPDSGAARILEHLIDAPDHARWMHKSQWIRPFQAGPLEELHIGWQLLPRQPRLTAPVAFLADARAISYAESIMGYVDGYALGPIFGSATAGANGNVAWASLPSGRRFAFTGMRVTRHDGGLLFGRGIEPTHPVTPTLEGVRAGRDEVLEAAVAWLRERI